MLGIMAMNNILANEDAASERQREDSNMELKDLVLSKLLARKVQVEEIESKIKGLAADIVADVKEAGQEIASMEQLADMVIDAVDAATNTGALDLIDAPIAKAMAHKLLQKK
jgi:hypothetical protein